MNYKKLLTSFAIIFGAIGVIIFIPYFAGYPIYYLGDGDNIPDWIFPHSLMQWMIGLICIVSIILISGMIAVVYEELNN